ncbi:zinc protease [Rhodovulum sp. ES.010]|uniref:M16 family metallopeptidase n=1 Tax=Rhodovulum sp. ES.010 TaxID=1882821 RepID=UPI000928EF80|nr:pitrilysin family protein [Rhodovulum sp. ES.010]SIO51326.1 zinc protease [Rhodovulum sp. ES.010]
MSMIRLVVAASLALWLAVPARAAVDIREVTSPGGIEAWLVESHDIPFVALEIRFRGGASLDTEGKAGATNLMTALLEEGAGEMDARAFVRARDALAASFRFDAGQDSLRVSARMLSENRDAAVELLRQALHAPRFDEDAIERVRAQVIAAIRSDAKDPNAIAAQTFDRLAFADHPYGRPVDGTEESVAALTRDDLREAHGRAIARDRVYVAAVGDITAEDLGALLDTLFEGVPENGAPLPGAADYGLEGGTTVVPFDTPQSVAVFGHEGMARDDPDFFAAYVMNEVLGAGGFESRLMKEVRVKRGLTYGVYSYIYPMDHAALMLGQVASANDKVAEAIAVIRDEWARMAETGVTEQELEDVKTYLTGAYPLRFDGNAPIARILVGMQMEGLSPDYVNTRNDRIMAVTLDEVRRVADELLQPERLHFVVVGRPEGIETTN